MRSREDEQVELLKDDALMVRLRAAIERRRPMVDSGDATALRLVHDAADGVSGIVVEKFERVLVVQHHEGRAAAELDRLKAAIESLMESIGVESVYLKRFVRDRSASGDADDAHRGATPWLGTPADEEFAIREGGMAFLIRPYDGFSTGLFLEHRDNRARIRSMAQGKVVLNLFAYTCGFSIAALSGGAEEVTSVDLSARYLEWGRRNFAANELDAEGHRFIRDDAMKFYERARRQERDYDLIVIDPPTFARIKKPKGVFVLADQIDDVLVGAVDRLRPGGTILFATNDRRLNRKVVEAAFHSATAQRKIQNIEWTALPGDFQGDPDYARSVLVKIR